MISLKKYLDSPDASACPQPQKPGVLAGLLAAYGSALLSMGHCAEDACPALGDNLKTNLTKLEGALSPSMDLPAVASTDEAVQASLRDWGQQTARHFQQKTAEVKELLLVMVRTAESVTARDQRSAEQFHHVTASLTTIASLEDITEIRASIEKSAADLKTSIDRMAEEGKSAITQLRTEVTSYQAKLEKAEAIAYRDSLTGLCSRLCSENQLQRHIEDAQPFCIAMVDIDAFKQVNDVHGHVAGDDLLKQFAGELRSACRAGDLIGRWGGDEFIILFNGELADAQAQVERVRKWVCGQYQTQGKSGRIRLNVSASIGLAEFRTDDAAKDLLARADAAMYENKAASRAVAR